MLFLFSDVVSNENETDRRLRKWPVQSTESVTRNRRRQKKYGGRVRWEPMRDRCCGGVNKKKMRRRRRKRLGGIMAPRRPIPLKMRDNPTHRSRFKVNRNKPNKIHPHSNLYHWADATFIYASSWTLLLVVQQASTQFSRRGRQSWTGRTGGCATGVSVIPSTTATTCGGRNGIICLWAGMIK